MRERWATFDCYGTLIDWNAGIGGVLARLFSPGTAPALLARYHELEPQVQAEDPTRSYREVLTVTLERVAADAGDGLRRGDLGALAASLPEWPPFPEVPPVLSEVRRRGWRLAILSNTDRDYVEASIARLGVPFDEAVVAGEIGSYKPAHRHWHEFFARTRVDRERHVHVAASLFHDIVPARELGLACVWINRLGEPADRRPTHELSDLSALPDTLDKLVPG